jgi:hypothetical protein
VDLLEAAREWHKRVFGTPGDQDFLHEIVSIVNENGFIEHTYEPHGVLALFVMEII